MRIRVNHLTRAIGEGEYLAERQSVIEGADAFLALIEATQSEYADIGQLPQLARSAADTARRLPWSTTGSAIRIRSGIDTLMALADQISREIKRVWGDE